MLRRLCLKGSRMLIYAKTENLIIMIKKRMAGLFIFVLLYMGCGPSEITLDTLEPGLVKDYMSAKKAYLNRNLKQALTGFRNLSQKQPLFFQARFMWGKTSYLTGNFEEAENVLKELLADYPLYYEAGLWLARTELSLGKKHEAETRIKNMLSVNSDDARLLILLAKINKENKDIQGALANLNQAVFYEEEVAATHLELGKIFYQFGMSDKALKELEICMLMLSENNIMKKSVGELINKIKGASNEVRNTGK
jgi:predicted Zn-dependent protease